MPKAHEGNPQQISATSFTINHLLIGRNGPGYKVFMGHMFENMQQLLNIDQAGLGRKIQGLLQGYSRTFFFISQGLNFFQILYNALFQPEASKWKDALNFFDSNIGDKPGLPHKLNRIEYESHLVLRSAHSDFYSVSCDFHTVF